MPSLAVLLSATLALADFPGRTWTPADPEASGWSAAKLDAARQFSLRAGSAAVVVIHKGKWIASWGDTAQVHPIRSMRKSLLSALYGPAVASGKIRLTDTLAGLAIDDKQTLTAAEKSATVADLLTSRSGVYHPAAYELPSAKAQRPARGSHARGEHFYYNNWDFNVLGTIYEKRTGVGIFEAFARQIAGPLQMQDFAKERTEYRREPESEHAAYLFQMSARDLARFGLLYLRRGQWNGAPLIPADWVRESTTAHVKVNERESYGYMFWVYGPNTRPGFPYYALRGAGGQYVVIAPEADLVVVHLTHTDNLVQRASDGTLMSDSDAWRVAGLIAAARPAE